MDVDCATDTSVDEDNEDNDAVAAAAAAASSAAAVDEDEEVDAHDDDADAEEEDGSKRGAASDDGVATLGSPELRLLPSTTFFFFVGIAWYGCRPRVKWSRFT